MSDKMNDLGDLIGKTAFDIVKSSALIYPGYVGIMTETRNTGYFDQFVDSWGFLLGVGIAVFGINLVKYFKDNYKVDRKDSHQVE